MEVKETCLYIVDSHQLSGSEQANNLRTFQKRYYSVIGMELSVAGLFLEQT